SKEQMKRERAKKRRRKEDEILKIPNGKSYQIFDYSSDEYAISSDTISESSSTPSSTASSEEDAGYKAENEELEGGASNEEMKENDDDVLFKRLRLPTSNNASQPISPPLKIKKFKKLSKSVCYSSGGDSDTGNAEKVLIYVDAAYPASASAGSDATCSVTPAPLGDCSGEQVNTDGAPYLEFLQKKKEEQPTVDTDEDLFSTDEEIDRIMESLIEEDSDENDPQPFFPIIEGARPLQLRTNHPWESREQYEERLQKELESAEK
uniref:Uncharacterized protein n=1 Tax=Caenorhabditis japonica TaxID=281687 RepID=A0A8R1EN43_CAEJA